jgi:hypothetical protein
MTGVAGTHHLSELHHLAATVTATSFRRAVTGLVIALVLLVPQRAWRLGRLAVTAVHESGHALMVLATGGQVGAVHLRADSSGVTWHRGVQGRWRRALTSAAGYPAPPLVGLAGAALVAAGHPHAWLGLLAALAALLAVVWVRNAFGWLLTVTAGVGLVWLLAAGPDRGVALAGTACAWYLGLGGLRAALEACGQHARWARNVRVSDSTELGRLAVLPAGVWRGIFVLTAAASVAGSAALLL